MICTERATIVIYCFILTFTIPMALDIMGTDTHTMEVDVVALVVVVVAGALIVDRLALVEPLAEFALVAMEVVVDAEALVEVVAGVVVEEEVVVVNKRSIISTYQYIYLFAIVTQNDAIFQ